MAVNLVKIITYLYFVTCVKIFLLCTHVLIVLKVFGTVYMCILNLNRYINQNTVRIPGILYIHT